MKNILKSAVKVLYILPAIFWCGIWGFLLIVFGFQTMDSTSWIYPVLSLAAAVLLVKDKWWGCFSGILMGLLIILLVQNEQMGGLYYCLYFAVMGLLCYFISRKERGK